MIHIVVFFIGVGLGIAFGIASPIFAREVEEYRRARYKRTTLISSVRGLTKTLEEMKNARKPNT